MISDRAVRLVSLSIEHDVAKVRKGAGWIPLDRLSLIRVFGPNRSKFLHNLLSNDINGLAEGQSRLASLMNLKGQQVAWMRVLAEKDALFCELPHDVRDVVVETFTHYKVGAPVRFEKPQAAILGLFGEQAAASLTALGLPALPSGPETFVSDPLFGGLRISRGRDMPASGFTIHGPADNEALKEHLTSRLGGPMQAATLETLRVEEGIPWHGIDVTEENLLHETGQLDVYHSPSKGCYLGQEVVARLEGRGGNVNKRFRGFRGSRPSVAGEDVVWEGKVIGSVTSAGLSPDFGAIAMGYVHRSHAEPGTWVSIGGEVSAVTVLPFTA
jgi:folate-binding protein YgfZ